MNVIDYYTFKIKVTSEIIFGDGHSEAGESSEMSGEVRSRSAGRELEAIRERLMDEIYNKKPLAGFFKAFRQMLNDPNDPNYKARQRIDIIFYVSEKYTAFKEDGESEDFENNFEYKKPYS